MGEKFHAGCRNIPVYLQGYFCGMPQSFPLNIIYRKIKIFKPNCCVQSFFIAECNLQSLHDYMYRAKTEKQAKKRHPCVERLTTILS
ncbi:hypothetical protein P9G78_20785 [Bacillus subtilis]|uniref:hypothetical protein n=1 Tax=Bacillus subtilis TaxID=1423 RepID=UPI002DB58F68|nr:hypothetical protein [Bacillus subtilis]MEC2237152.1 hypothetical protein [Bacillus subtilis]